MPLSFLRKKRAPKRASIPINFQLFPLYLSTNNSYCRLTECFSRRFTTSLGSCWTCDGPNNGGLLTQTANEGLLLSYCSIRRCYYVCCTMLYYVILRSDLLHCTMLLPLHSPLHEAQLS